MKPIYENIPQEIKLYPQWVNWKSVERDGKATKPPFQPDGSFAKADNPATWNTFNIVKEAVDRFDGIGFMLSDDDPFVGVDFDKCYCPAFELIDPVIDQHLKSLNTYTEISPSGRGLRALLRGRLPVDGRKNGRVELYQARRYVTITGHRLPGYPAIIEARQAELETFYQKAFPEKAEDPKQTPANTRQVSQPLNCDWRDRLKTAFHSKHGVEIKRLWDGDITKYDNDDSAADMALCSHLAFWFNGDAGAIDQVFRESKLFRKKWDEKHFSDGKTYGEATINVAIRGCTEFYQKSEIKNDFLPLPTAALIIDQLKDEIKQNKERGCLGIDPDFDFLRKTIKAFIPGHLWIVGGYTSHGKSAFAVELISRVLCNFFGVHITLFSTEMGSKSYLLRLVGNRTGITSLSILQGNHIPEVQKQIEEAFSAISKDNLIIFDDVYQWEQIAEKARSIKAQVGLDLLFVDYLQNVVSGGNSIYERMSLLAPQIQALAKELSCTIIVMSQVSNESVKESSDVIGYKGAGEIAAAADLGLWLEREKSKQSKGYEINSEVLNMVIRKNRHGPLGKSTLRFINNFTGLIED